MRVIGFGILALSAMLVMLGLGLHYGAVPLGFGQEPGPAQFSAPAGPADTLSARFKICGGGARDNCVVDGDTIWFAGEKIRVLDINTPEISTPQCDREYELGMRATDRLVTLMNEGPFSLQSGGEDTDRYGRKLRRIVRGGQSLGDILVAEGLAEKWQGYRGGWC